WGFTVDDAWIVSRVAAHGAGTGVYSFNPGGPATDAVTPLGFAHVLGHVGRLLRLESPLEFWGLARWIGAAAYAFSAALAGFLVAAQNGRFGVYGGAALLLFTLPAAAWSGAGLETPIVGLLVVSGAFVYETPHKAWGSLLLGAAAGWRPELLPFALAVLVTRWPWPERLPRAQLVFQLLLALLPSV